MIPWELLVLMKTPKAGLICGSILAEQMGGKFLSRHTGFGIVRTLFPTALTKEVPVRLIFLVYTIAINV